MSGIDDKAGQRTAQRQNYHQKVRRSAIVPAESVHEIYMTHRAAGDFRACTSWLRNVPCFDMKTPEYNTRRARRRADADQRAADSQHVIDEYNKLSTARPREKRHGAHSLFLTYSSFRRPFYLFRISLYFGYSLLHRTSK